MSIFKIVTLIFTNIVTKKNEQKCLYEILSSLKNRTIELK